MKIDILQEKDNPLLDRREVRFKMDFTSGVPSIKEVRKEIISKIKSDEKLTILDSINTKFGIKTLVGYVKVYKDEKSMKVESEARIKKNFKIKEKEDKEEREEQVGKKEDKTPKEKKEEESAKEGKEDKK